MNIEPLEFHELLGKRMFPKPTTLLDEEITYAIRNDSSVKQAWDIFEYLLLTSIEQHLFTPKNPNLFLPPA